MTRPAGQRGSAAVELTLAVPALMLVLALLVAGGRLWFARATVADSAYAAARAGSLARSAGEATADGERAGRRSLDTAGLHCAGQSTALDTGAFAVPVGTPATVRATVRCTVPFGDLLLPGMPGSVSVEATGAAALDTYRGAELMRRDQRGQAVSVFLCVVLTAMIVTAGLVIDGGQQVTAATRAQVAAAGAARAATDAGATYALAGRSGAGPAVLAARTYLAGQPGVTGTVDVSAGVVTIRTSATEPTVFLAAIGIGTVHASGSASAVLVATGER